MEGEGQVNGNPSSALTSTVMVDGVLYRFKLRSSESTISFDKAPKSSHYVDLSQYPPGTDIESELHWDGYRVVSKVPKWAHEKWLRKYQDPDGTITPEDTSPLRDAAAPAYGGRDDHPNFASATAGGRDDHPNFASATAVLERPHIREALARLRRIASDSGPNQVGERPCEDHLNSASATASGTKALKRPCEDLVENPSPTAAAAYDGKRPCEDQHLNSASATAGGGAAAEVRDLNLFAYPYAYAADPSECAFDDYPGRYFYSVEDDGRVVLKVNKYAAPFIKIGGIRSSKVIGGVYHAPKLAEVLKVDGGKRKPI